MSSEERLYSRGEHRARRVCAWPCLPSSGSIWWMLEGDNSLCAPGKLWVLKWSGNRSGTRFAKLKAYLLVDGGYHSLWNILLNKQRLLPCLWKVITSSLGGQEGKTRADVVAAGAMAVPVTSVFCLCGRGFFRARQHMPWRREGPRF